MADPTKAQRRAVREVVYDRRRLRRMAEHLSSIDVLMNTDPRADLQPDDVRVVAGAGPMWFLPDGRLTPAVSEAADRCDRVAAILRAVSRDLADVDVPARHRRHLRRGFEAQAAAWEARGQAWRDPRRRRPRAAADRIADHLRAARRAHVPVKAYLREDVDLGRYL